MKTVLNRSLSLLSTTTIALLGSSSVMAHDLWVNMPPVKDGKSVTIEMGYGHDFPQGETISAERLAIFAPIVLSNGFNKIELALTSTEYSFKQNNLAEGSYLAVATYKPTMWSVRSKDGKEEWQQKSKRAWPESEFCMETTMSAKTVSVVGPSSNNPLISKALNLRLEFVPNVDPNTLKVGDELTVKLLQNGKALANHEIGILYNDGKTKTVHDHAHEDHHHDSNSKKLTHPSLAHTYAYEDAVFKEETDENGELSIPVSAKGQWLLVTAADQPRKNKAECEIYLDKASFSYYISK